MLDFRAIGNAVAVGVGVVHVGTKYSFDQIWETIAIAIWEVGGNWSQVEARKNVFKSAALKRKYEAEGFCPGIVKAHI